jgi:hypothetical protein
VKKECLDVSKNERVEERERKRDRDVSKNEGYKVNYSTEEAAKCDHMGYKETDNIN